MTDSEIQLLMNNLLKGVEEGIKLVAETFWSMFKSLWIEHWLLITTIYFGLLIILYVKAVLGRWGSLAKMIRHTFSFGIILLFIGIRGPQIVFSDYFELVYIAIIYPISYFLTGQILVKLKVIR